jgi:subtilisin family serine protease
MARRSAITLVAASLLGLTACGDQATSLLSPTARTNDDLTLAAPPGLYLLGFDGTPAISPDVLAASGGHIVDSVPALRVLAVDGVTNPQALLAAQPKYVEAGFEVTVAPIVQELPLFDGLQAVAGQENTPWFQSHIQWDMRTIHAEDGWARTNGGTGVNVCIIDTGVDDTHQELNGGKVTLRANFVTTEPRVDDPNGHGSHVASTVAAKGVVISGVAPRANIMSARVLNQGGSGQEPAILNGIFWCVDNGANVINMSLGGARYRPLTGYQESINAYQAAVDYATSNGVVMIVAAGNSNLRLPNKIQTQVPSQIPGVINVGATGPVSKSTSPLPPAWNPLDPAQVWRSVDYKSFFSNFGLGVAVFAPGGSGGPSLSDPYRLVNGVAQGRGALDLIWGACSPSSSQNGNGNVGGIPGAGGPCAANATRYLAFAGTSQAAPHVAGLAALLYEQLGATRSADKRAQIECYIKSTTDVIGPSTTYGGGRINVTRALDKLAAGRC